MAKEPGRSWADIVDDPMRGEIPHDFRPTLQEAKDILVCLSPIASRLEKNPATQVVLMCLRCIANGEPTALNVAETFVGMTKPYLGQRQREIEAMPDSTTELEAEKTQALRDLTSLHNAITDVACKAKGPPSQSGWGIG